MVSPCSIPFLLASFVLFLGLSLDTVETVSCPATRINASAVCDGVERNDIDGPPDLTHLVCDNLRNLPQVNHTFILGVLEFGLRKSEDVPIDIARVLFSKVDGEVLETALQEFSDLIENFSLISHPWKTAVLTALWDERLRNEERFNETAFVAAWFQKWLRPFLSAVSPAMLRCLWKETMHCVQYQSIVKGLDLEFTKMSHQTQEDVFRLFQLPYLKGLNSNGSACAVGLNSSEWLAVNFGTFGRFAEYRDFVSLNSRFDGLDALKSLTVKQLGELSATGGDLETPRDVRDLMAFIDTSALAEYVDEFNRWANGSLPSEIRASLLDRVLERLQAVDDAEFMVWMGPRLRHLISAFNGTLLPRLFDHLEDRTCFAIGAATALLNSSRSEFSDATRRSIFEAILGVAANSSLRCYPANSSFAEFLRETFRGFADHLTLRDLGTLIRAGDLHKIVNTIPPDVLAAFFARDGFLNEDPFLTTLLRAYQRNEELIDNFNRKAVFDVLSNDTKAALLAGVWFTAVTSRNATEVDLWLGTRLSRYFSFLNGGLLNASQVLNASCATFRKIVSRLSDGIAAFRGREEEIYYSIKAYLTAAKTRPRCYNASNPDWLYVYLRTYIRYSSARDMRLLTKNSAAAFRDLAIDPANLELLNHVTIRKDLAEMYAAALYAADSGFDLDDLPDQLICFARHSSRISNFTQAQALNLIRRVNLHCQPENPSSSDRQLALKLVERVEVFDGETLVALGQQAVGLTAGQISNLTAPELVDLRVLESLGRVRGWNGGQSQALVERLLHSNYTLDSPEKFERLGTLVQGLPSDVFDNISANMAIRLAKSSGFVGALSRGPEYLKKAFVSKILSNVSSLGDILDSVPNELAGQVPSSMLVFRGGIPDLREINEKQWSPQQAAVLFGDILSSTDNYTELSGRILQGFQCGAASRLSPPQLESLVQEVKAKHANLSREQLSCMAKLLTKSNRGANFTSYPADVLLFFPLGRVDNRSCGEFFALASQGNLSLLTDGSAHRTSLRDNALDCFGVANASLTKQQLQSLGAFVCDMDPNTIRNSDPVILENLKLCPDLTTWQQSALDALLSSGKTQYGVPASWDEGVLEALGPLVFYMNRTTWESVDKEERMAFFRNVAEMYDSQSPSERQKTLLLLKSMGSKSTSSGRSKRATESCQSGPITASTLEDPLFVIQYDSIEQFDACLSDEVLKANLAPLLDQPLPDNYLAVIKSKLDEIYPDGIPDDQLKLLSYLSHLYSPEEISKWKVTSGDTLAALLSPDNGAWKPDQLKQLISTYMELGGKLTGPLLSMLGGVNLCLLEAGQLGQISPESVRQAEKLDISSCSQDKKDILYGKARVAFAGQEGTSAYYPLIQPYLGGAPVEDLRKLARSQVAMDIDTFTNLKPEELKKLSVRDVKDLLAVHLPDLKDVENHPSVAMWIKSHLQSELDTLGIGLQGGMMGPSPTASTEMGGTTADGPSIAVSSTVPTAASTVSTVSSAAISDANAATFSNTRISPLVATDSFTTPLFKVTLAPDETSAPTEATNATSASIHPEAAVPTDAIMTSNVTATSEETFDGSLVPTAAVDTGTTAPSATSASRDITTSGAILEVGSGVDTTTSVDTLTVPTNVTTGAIIFPSIATHINATTPVDTTTVSTNITTDGTSLPTVASHINGTTSVDTTAVFTNITTDGSSDPTIASHINSTTSVNTTMAPTNVTTDGTIQPTVASQINATTSVDTTVASTNITTNETLQPTVASHINATTSVDTTTVSTNVTTDGTIQPTIASRINATTSVNTTVASTNITTNGTIQPTTAMHINATTSVNTTVASTNVTTAWTILPTVARNVNVTSTPNVTISHTPSLNINHMSTTPNMTATMSSEWPPAPPALPNDTVPVSPSTPPVTSGKIPAASSRTTVRSSETPHKTAASPSPDQPRTTIVMPERGTTGRAPPKTKQPSHPTPNGYIIVRPLSALASSPSLSRLLLTPSIAVGLSVLRRLF